MMTRREPIYIGTCTAPLLRVVRDRTDEIALGVQTGLISHRHQDVPVWRPANPRALGLDHSWRDGHWRNIYQVTLVVAPYERDELYLREAADAGDVAVLLPAAKLVRTAAIERYLRQQR